MSTQVVRRPNSLVSSGPRQQEDGHAHCFTAVCMACGSTAEECGYVFRRVVIDLPLPEESA